MAIDLQKAIDFANGKPQPGQIDYTGQAYANVLAELDRLFPLPQRKPATDKETAK